MHIQEKITLVDLPQNTQRLMDIFTKALEIDQHLHQQTNASQQLLPKLAKLSTAKDNLGPKFPSQPFNYLDRLTQQNCDTPVKGDELLDEVSRFFHGAIRPQSPNSLFNMVPDASASAIAASWLVTAYNSNLLMDAFGGEGLLIEQQVARTIGSWAGWPESMGIACNGGKYTLLYGIKSALSRIAPDSLLSGLPDDLVIICSEGAHYCVEHAASLLGLGSNRCLRVANSHSGQMDLLSLHNILVQQHTQGKRVAAIICCGGTTINFNCEDTSSIQEVVDNFVAEHKLPQRPYLHLDSVIGWLYLTLRDCTSEQLQQQIEDPVVRARIAQVLERLNGVEGFDSLGVDFHKNGLCPYASSFFISKDRRFMDELGDGNYQYSGKDFDYGQFRAYRYTFDNSRPGQGILASWINLRQLGRSGLADYLILLHTARNELVSAIDRHGRFQVLNTESFGWEVVFDIQFSPNLLTGTYLHQDVATAFMQFCWQRINAGYDLPFFSIIPAYTLDHSSDQSITAFLLYPMQQQSAAYWDSVITDIAIQLDEFETHLRQSLAGLDTLSYDKPIR
jgi:glutamate/tyrosine decarboxylase-like PLP-dependent enzyme